MQVLENNLPGVNQRLLKTESIAFWKLNGTWPYQNGIQNRIFGKNLIQVFDNPVKAIFQTFTPYGYFGGIFQTLDTIDTGKWDPPIFNFPVNNGGTGFVIPDQLPINQIGETTGAGDVGSNGTTGAGGTNTKYVISVQTIPLPITDQGQLFDGAVQILNVIQQDCGFSVPNQPQCVAFDYPAKPTLTSPFVSDGSYYIFASYESAASTHLATLPHPPANYNNQIVTDQSINPQQYTTCVMLFSLALIGATEETPVVGASFNAHINVDGVGSDIKIPFNLPVMTTEAPSNSLTIESRNLLHYSTTGFTPPIGMAGPFDTKSIAIGYCDISIVDCNIFTVRKVTT